MNFSGALRPFVAIPREPLSPRKSIPANNANITEDRMSGLDRMRPACMSRTPFAAKRMLTRVCPRTMRIRRLMDMLGSIMRSVQATGQIVVKDQGRTPRSFGRLNLYQTRKSFAWTNRRLLLGFPNHNSAYGRGDCDCWRSPIENNFFNLLPI